MAIKNLNDAGGLQGRPVRMEIQDDACDPKQAVSVANLVATRKVRFVVGHACSGRSIPASAVYAEEGVLMISPASSAPSPPARRGAAPRRAGGDGAGADRV